MRFNTLRTVRGGVLLYSLVVLATMAFIGGASALLNLGASTPNPHAINLSSGLVGYWKFNGNLNDSSGNNNTGTPIITLGKFTTGYDGTSNGAYVMSSSANAVDVGTPANFNGMYAANGVGFTYSVWVKWSGKSSSYGWPWIMGSGSGANSSMLTHSSGAGLPYFQYPTNDTGSSNYGVGSNSRWGAGEWHMLTYAYTGNTGSNNSKFYYDGTQVAINGNANFLSAVGTDFMFGNRNNGDTWLGAIDDARVYNRALSAAEISALYGTRSTTTLDSSQQGLVGWWKLNGNAKDSTPYSNNGTWSGTSAYTTDRENTANGAASLSSGRQVNISNSPNLNVTSTNLSISAWIKPNVTLGSMSPYPFIVYKRGGSSPNFNGYALYFSGNNLIFDKGTAAATYESSYGTSLMANTWYHVAATTNSSSIKLYINGSLVKTVSIGNSPILSNTGSLAIGSSSASDYFNGSISDVRLYNRALSTSEIKTQYQSYNSQLNLTSYGLNQSLSMGLVGYWPFNGNARDITPYSNNGTVNGAILTTDRSGRASSAYSFNGTSSIQSSGIGGKVLQNLTGNMTLSYWINPALTGTFNSGLQQVVSKRANTNSSVPWSSYVTPDGRVRFEYTKGDGTNGWIPVVSSPNALQANTWALVTVTRSPTATDIYINGTLNTNSPGQTTPAWASDVDALNFGGNTVQYSAFVGSIDDVRIYNRALTASEVQALYNTYN